jgi:hypothetical protein
MTRLAMVSSAVLAAGMIRQMFVLSGIVRAAQFLRHGRNDEHESVGPKAPVFFLTVPVLREETILEETVAHFQQVASNHNAVIVIVTTAREIVEEAVRGVVASGTIELAEKLAGEGKCVHLHYPDPAGLKADQLNYSAVHCQALLVEGRTARQAFMVCYDADSRPPTDSLACFASAIAANPGSDVFHQSARFELRPDQCLGRLGFGRLRAVICDSGALRANRFVLGFEIPRLLNSSDQVSPMKRTLCSGVYAHVTGHGLCVRLSLLEGLPFPAHSPLEDMHYSFILGSRRQPMIPVPSLDCAAVPSAVIAQVHQAARWIFGPARFYRYLRDSATQQGWRAWAMAASACGSAIEWIGCAIVPTLVFLLIAFGAPGVRAAAMGYLTVCALQVVLTETWLGAPGPPVTRILRIVAFPVACTVHGTGGILGWTRLLTGGSGVGKTERGIRP